MPSRRPAALRNAGGLPFLVLKGHYVVRARQRPDGDTLAFAASAEFRSGQVETNVPVSPTGEQTSSIRLQSIDAPEKAQPMGAASRDALLKRMGFSPSALGLTQSDFTAKGPTALQPGWLATHGLDGNRRPLGYVFQADPGFAHGSEVSAEALLPAVRRSVNLSLVRRGHAYPAFYSNTEEVHAVVFQRAAAGARSAGRGVWFQDRTTLGFRPTRLDLGPQGVLIYPKLFRRVEDWKDARPDANAFIAWLKSVPDGRKLVTGADRDPVPLWKLFVKLGRDQVAIPYDVTKLWFSE